MLGDSCLPTQTGQEIRHVHLVIQHQQRDDVAMRRQVRARVEGRGSRRELRRNISPDVRARDVHNRHVAEVPCGNLHTGYVPPAPAIFDRRPMVGRPPLCVLVLVVRQRQLAHREEPGHAGGLRREVALEAIGAANELRLLLRLLRDRIKLNSLGGVEHRRFHGIGALRPRDGYGVVEVNRPRRRLADVRALQAVLGKDERLRRGRDVERLQHRLEIATRRRVEGELQLTFLDPLVEPDDRVARGARGVPDRRVISREPEHIRALSPHHDDTAYACGESCDRTSGRW